MHGSYQVRRARAEDIDGIVTCLFAAFSQYRSAYTPEAFADTVSNSVAIKERLMHMCVLVAVSEHTIFGTIACVVNGTDAHLRGMAVLPSSHGSGVGSALLRAAEKEARQSGCTRLTLDTTEPLQRAVAFYRKHGFAESGRVSEFFGMPLYEYVKLLCDDSA